MTVPPILWRLDPDTWVLVGGPSSLSAGQVRASRWPVCPVCAGRIEVETIEVSTWARPGQFMIGQWECPAGCDPHDSDPRITGR